MYVQQFRIEQIHLQHISYNAFSKELRVFSSLKIENFFVLVVLQKHIYTNSVHTHGQ